MPALVLLASVSLSVAAYAVTASLIPRLGKSFIDAGLKGKDMLKGDNRGGGGAGAVKGRSGKAANGATTNGTSNTEVTVVADRPAITGKDLYAMQPPSRSAS